MTLTDGADAQLKQIPSGFSSTVRKTYDVYGVPQNARAVVLTSTDDTLENPSILYVTGTGDVKVDLWGSGTITVTVPDDSFLKLLVRKVYKVGTNATGIFALW